MVAYAVCIWWQHQETWHVLDTEVLQTFRRLVSSGAPDGKTVQVRPKVPHNEETPIYFLHPLNHPSMFVHLLARLHTIDYFGVVLAVHVVGGLCLCDGLCLRC